jgi:hypothetical protein
MNIINKLIIFLLLAGLIYALYKYQDIIFTTVSEKFTTTPTPLTIKPKSTTKKQITADNISQLSYSSLDDKNNEVYQKDSILDSLNSGSNDHDIRSLLSDNSGQTNDELFF